MIAWDEFVTGLFPQFFENRIERRILKFLRDDCAFQIEKTTGETEPFEVAVVVTGDHQTTLRACVTRGLAEILQLNELGKVFLCQARAPEQINHGSRKMLERCNRNNVANSHLI